MTVRWVNHVVIAAPRNGTTSHTVDPNAGTVVSGANFTPTAGRLLVCVVSGGVTSTTPSGWTLPSGGSAIGNVGLYVWHRTAAGGDTISTTHNGANYPCFFEFFEFLAGSTFKGSAAANGVVAAGGAGPTLSGMTGTTQYFAAVSQPNPDVAPHSITWSAGTELVDTSSTFSSTDGNTYSLAYLDDSIATSWASAATSTYTAGFSETERLVFGVGVPAGTAPTITTTALNAMTVGSAFSQTLAATGDATITFAVTSGTLPAGLSLSTAGALTGTPTTAGAYSFTVTATNSTGSDPQAYSGTVAAAGPLRTIAEENALTGTARATWDLTSAAWGGVSTLQGFADGFSFNRDETINFKIAQSDTAGWTADVYRLGWYGGDGARSYGTLTPNGAQLTASQSQPAPTDADSVTTKLSADCSNWAVTLTWTVPAEVPSGIFLLKLNRTGGGASHVMFVVRDDARSADLMFMPADMTWMAYNAFGGMGSNQLTGNSLYYGTGVDQYNADAARVVSYDKPFVNRAAVSGGYGAVQWSTFFTGEYPMLRFLERNGIDVKYYSCLDAAGDATGAKLAGSVDAAMFVGHNEYWSNGMRAGWEAFKAAGGSVFSCAGNEVFWRIVGVGTNDSKGRPRQYECYKSTIAARASTGRTEWTGTWRDPDGAGKGGNNPENNLTGTIFAVNGPDLRALVVPYAASGGNSASPLWRNTAAAAIASGSWTSPSQILGFEWDTYGPAGTNGTGSAYMAAPAAEAHYASSTTAAISGLMLTDAGDQYGSGNVTHKLVVKKSSPSSGGITFGTGTINWALGVDSANTFHSVGSDNTSAVIQQATLNMLRDMGCAPTTTMSGLTTPTAYNWAPILVPPSTNTGGMFFAA